MRLMVSLTYLNLIYLDASSLQMVADYVDLDPCSQHDTFALHSILTPPS